MIGSIIGAAVFTLSSGWGYFPADLRTVVQLLSGPSSEAAFRKMI
jgi:hypothetical protein